MTLVAALLGVGVAAGVLMIVSGLGLSGEPSRLPRLRLHSDAGERVGPAVGAAVVVGALTRWPIAAIAVGVGAWYWPELFGGRAARERATTRTEAIAAWTEMLRDTISGAHGLEEAVLTTAAVAPAAIRTEVSALAVRLEQEPLDVALRAFAVELAHPTGDLVVAALTLAARGSAGELVELLGTLAVAARDEAAMRLRVEAARARLRTAVRVIAASTATTAVGLILLNRSYLAVYATPTGQVVLAFVAIAWGMALRWLAGMSEYIAPERFLILDSAEPGGSR
jgi:tight adherence protein B